jgi:hypothetical protein
MNRRIGLVALLICVGAALTACSPPFIGTIGIQRNADGTLSALVRVCRGSVYTLLVHPVNSFPTERDGGSTSDDWESAADIETELDPVVTDRADVRFPAEEESLKTNVLYELWAAGEDGNAFSGLFGASELAALKSGEVLADPMRDDEERDYVRDHGRGGIFMLVTPAEFEKRAVAFCNAYR